VNGKDGLNYYSNVGLNEWALLVDHLMYGDEHALDGDASGK